MTTPASTTKPNFTLRQAAGDRRGQAVTYHQLGRVAQEQRRFDEAETTYRQALDIKLEFGDRHSAGQHLPPARHGRPGAAAVRRGRGQPTARPSTSSWSSATGTAPPAPTTSSAGSPRSSGGTTRPRPPTARPSTSSWSSATGTAPPAPTTSSAGSPRSSGGTTEAETAYRQALDINLEFGDRHSAAGTYHQLGIVAQDQRRFDEAETNYRQALDIYLEFGDRHNAANTYHAARHRSPRTSGGTTRPKPTTARPSTSTWSTATSTAPLIPTTRSASSPKPSSATTKPKPTTAKHSISAANPTREPHRRRPPGWVLCSQSLASTERRHAPSSTPPVSWHQETGQWAGEDLQGLRRERAVIGPDEFTGLVEADLPADLARDLIAAIDTADSTGDAGEPDSEDHAAGS